MSLSDQTFTVIADYLVENLPTTSKSRRAFQTYQKRFQKQVDRAYAEAFQLYFESLSLETDPIARSFTFYNIGLMYHQLNQTHRALMHLNQSVRLNPSHASAMNMLAIVYHRFGEAFLHDGVIDRSDLFFGRARQYWSEAIRLAPYQYLEAQNWLLSTKP